MRYFYVRLDKCQLASLKPTASSHIEMDGWKISFLVRWPILRGELLVSGSVILVILVISPGSSVRDPFGRVASDLFKGCW